MTPPNERKAKERKAKRDAGLVRVEVWVPAPRVEEVKAMLHLMAELDADVRRVTGIDDAMLGALPKDTATP
jgi:hypothetical protein